LCCACAAAPRQEAKRNPAVRRSERASARRCRVMGMGGRDQEPGQRPGMGDTSEPMGERRTGWGPPKRAGSAFEDSSRLIENSFGGPVKLRVGIIFLV